MNLALPLPDMAMGMRQRPSLLYAPCKMCIRDKDWLCVGVCGDGRGLARDSELYALCIIVSNSVLDLNCNCSLSMLFGCVCIFRIVLRVIMNNYNLNPTHYTTQ